MSEVMTHSLIVHGFFNVMRIQVIYYLKKKIKNVLYI